MKSFKSCNICKGKLIKFEINLPFFSHYRFEKKTNKIILYKCNLCKLFHNFNYKKYNNFFITKKYSDSNQSGQKIFNKNMKDSLTRTKIQSLEIKKILKNQFNRPLNILDFGCFDGSLLKEIKKDFKNIHLYGFDKNKYLKKFFKDTKINFSSSISTYLKKNIKFDMIIFSHSIMYVDNLKTTLEFAHKILRKDGYIYIQLPNINFNPFYSLMADQRYFFSESNLINSFNILNFNVKKIYNANLERELIFLGKIKYFKEKTFLNDQTIEKNYLIIQKIKKILEYKYQNEYIVMGMTLNAAFIYEVLKKRILYFVDESIKKNIRFKNKLVKHPSEIKLNENVIMPYFNKKIVNKFKQKYKGNFISLSQL